MVLTIHFRTKVRGHTDKFAASSAGAGVDGAPALGPDAPGCVHRLIHPAGNPVRLAGVGEHAPGRLSDRCRACLRILGVAVLFLGSHRIGALASFRSFIQNASVFQVLHRLPVSLITCLIQEMIWVIFFPTFPSTAAHALLAAFRSTSKEIWPKAWPFSGGHSFSFAEPATISSSARRKLRRPA